MLSAAARLLLLYESPLAPMVESSAEPMPFIVLQVAMFDEALVR